MLEEQPRILVNGGELCVDKESPESYLSALFLLGFEMNLNYWSFEGIRDFYYGCVNLVKEFSQEKRNWTKGPIKSRYSRFIKIAERRLLRKKFGESFSLLESIYNQILSCENLNVLSGFRFSKSTFNAEKSSILNGKTLNVKRVLQQQKEERKREMAEKVKFNELKKAIKAFNELEFVEEKIKIVGVKKEDLYEKFLTAIEDVVDDHEEELPEEVIEVYNVLAGTGEEEEETEEKEEEEEEEEEKPKKEKKKEAAKGKDKKETKPKKEKAKKISWIEASVQAIKKSKTKQQAIEKAQDIFKEGGGKVTKDVEKWAALNVGRAERVMVLVEVLDVDEKGKYSFSLN